MAPARSAATSKTAALNCMMELVRSTCTRTVRRKSVVRAYDGTRPGSRGETHLKEYEVGEQVAGEGYAVSPLLYISPRRGPDAGMPTIAGS